MENKVGKSRSAVIYIPVAALLIVFLSIFGISVFLRITLIEVDGARRYTEDEIIQAAGIMMGENVLFVNILEAQGRIEREFLYISEVRIRRVPPGTIRIYVEEREPVAWLRVSGAVAVIDSAGIVHQRTNVLPPGLIELRGIVPTTAEEGNLLRIESGAAALNDMLTVLEAIEEAGIGGDVTFIEMDNIVGITFGYRGRFRVEVGDSRGIQHKLQGLPDLAQTAPDHVTGRLVMVHEHEWRWIPDR